MPYQTLLRELTPNFNPAGIEASMRLHYGTLNHLPRIWKASRPGYCARSPKAWAWPTTSPNGRPAMPLDPAQRHQIEQDAITATWEDERLAACDDAVALLREIADLERDDDGDVILGAETDGHNVLMVSITTFLATHDR